jgi:hypothetical protein
MKKILLSIAVILMLFACQNEPTDVTSLETSASEEIGTSKLRMASEKIGASVRRICASQEVHEAQLAADPTLAIRMKEIEEFTKKSISNKNFRLSSTGKIIIPVVVNVLQTSSEAVLSDAQIQSQIDVLNKDFTAKNPDFANVPAEWSGVKANIDITFELVKVIKKETTVTAWGTRDAMKSSKRGGINPTSPTTTLNIWVCTIGNNILGYAQFPGGKSATDGVVIDSRCFGTIGTLYTYYNLGRTATHEVGHWMNLRHIWGDSSCGNDYVADTPVHKTANYTEVYPFPSTCEPVGHNEMTMNYMDYSNDDLMYMFTNGQKSRMHAIFASGGPRASFGKP